MEGEIRHKLWAECANTFTHLDGILISPNEKKSSYQKTHTRNPAFINNLRVFGEVGIILTHKQIGFKSKLDEKGSVGIFVGYATEHGGDVYRMNRLTTQRVRISRDVRWLGKFHVEGKYVDIPGYSRNNEI